MGSVFEPTDDEERKSLDCPKCGAEVRHERALEQHDTAVHQQSLTDEHGCCKMCGDPVDEAGWHLREECDPHS